MGNTTSAFQATEAQEPTGAQEPNSLTAHEPGPRPATASGSFEKQFAKQYGSHIIWVPNEEFSRRRWHLVITCVSCGVKHSRDSFGDSRSDEEYMRQPCSCGGQLAHLPFFPPTAEDLRSDDEEFAHIPCPQCGTAKKMTKCVYSDMGFHRHQCPCGIVYQTSRGSNYGTVVD